MNNATSKLQTLIPLRNRILYRKDDDKQETRGGIVLPDDVKIPTITGRVVEISRDLENDIEFPVNKYDKVIINPSRAIPVDFEIGNKLYIVPSEDVIAVFKTEDEDEVT